MVKSIEFWATDLTGLLWLVQSRRGHTGDWVWSYLLGRGKCNGEVYRVLGY